MHPIRPTKTWHSFTCCVVVIQKINFINPLYRNPDTTARPAYFQPASQIPCTTLPLLSKKIPYHHFSNPIHIRSSLHSAHSSHSFANNFQTDQIEIVVVLHRIHPPQIVTHPHLRRSWTPVNQLLRITNRFVELMHASRCTSTSRATTPMKSYHLIHFVTTRSDTHHNPHMPTRLRRQSCSTHHKTSPPVAPCPVLPY